MAPSPEPKLTRVTGLDRSTNGTLVADLQERRLVDAVDVAIVSLGGRVPLRVLRGARHQNERIPTPTEFVTVVAAVINDMRPEVDARYRTLGIGLSVPSLVRVGDGEVVLAPHLGWRDKSVSAILAAAAGFSVVAGNDASCGVVPANLFAALPGARSDAHVTAAGREPTVGRQCADIRPRTHPDSPAVSRVERITSTPVRLRAECASMAFYLWRQP